MLASQNVLGTHEGAKTSLEHPLNVFQPFNNMAEATNHEIHPKYVELKETNVNSVSQRLLGLESWHSQADKNVINECQHSQVYINHL